MKTIFAILVLMFSGHAGAAYLSCPKISCRALGCIPSQLRGATINSDIGYFSTYYDDGAGFELTEEQIFVQGTKVTFDREKDCQEQRIVRSIGVSYFFTCDKGTDHLEVQFNYDPAVHSGFYKGEFNRRAIEFIFKKCDIY